MRCLEPIAIKLRGGETIRGDLRFTDEPGGRAIVFVHGFASHRNGEKSLALQENCARRDATFAAIDFRGNGESDGSLRDFRPSRLLEDLAALRDWLVARGIKKIGLVGSSMGGFASAWFALQCDEVKACVLIAPALRFVERKYDSLSEFEREYWRRAGWVRYQNEYIDVEVGYGLIEERLQFPFEQLAARWTKPALIFHGLADDTVPAADSIDFQQRANAPIELRLFKNGDHRLTAIKDELAEEACRYLGRQMLAH